MPYPTDDVPELMVGAGERLLGDLAVRGHDIAGEQTELAVVAADTYLERGRPVVVLVRGRPCTGAPRNVLIRRECGTLVVRPFRGLRRPKG